jgi:propionyl-CoA synthetase
MLRRSLTVGKVLTPQAQKLIPRRQSYFKMTREEAYKMSISDPTKFWSIQASKIDWFQPYSQVITQTENGHGTWFEGGKLNTCYNALDRHVHRGHGDRIALIYDSPVTNTIQHFTYQQLLNEVQQLAAYMQSHGVVKGDRIVIYMPNIPQAAIAMLACARIGAIHSVVFGGFAAHELAVRIKDCTPKMIISSSCGIDGNKIIDYKTLLDNALEIVAPDHIVQTCIIYQRSQLIVTSLQVNRDITWEEVFIKGKAILQEEPSLSHCTHVNATDPLYILYTSGTTGAPKGVVRDNGGHAVALIHSMQSIYGIYPGDIFWAASDVGWVVGHSYGLYGPLLTGATTVMYEGKPVGTPDAANFWRTLARHRVNAFFTAPTAIRAMKRVDVPGQLAKEYDLSALRTIHLAGEHADKDTLVWLEHATQLPVRDHWWQTETGWAICADSLDTIYHTQHSQNETIYGSCYQPTTGYHLQLFQDQTSTEEITTPNLSGQIFLKLPLPPGTLTTLYNAPQRFKSSYLTSRKGYYDTGDAGYRDEYGNVFVMARTDDVINVAGHRLSSGALEEAICLHDNVTEAAVVGVKDSFKGQVPLGLIVLNAECNRSSDEISKEVIALVRERIGPVAAFKQVVIVPRLPKTRSGKTLRATLRQIANGETPKIPATIEDPSVLQEVTQVIHEYTDHTLVTNAPPAKKD